MIPRDMSEALGISFYYRQAAKNKRDNHCYFVQERRAKKLHANRKHWEWMKSDFEKKFRPLVDDEDLEIYREMLDIVALEMVGRSGPEISKAKGHPADWTYAYKDAHHGLYEQAFQEVMGDFLQASRLYSQQSFLILFNGQRHAVKFAVETLENEAAKPADRKWAADMIMRNYAVLTAVEKGKPVGTRKPATLPESLIRTIEKAKKRGKKDHEIKGELASDEVQ